MKKELIKDVYEKAIEVLRKVSTKQGFFASYGRSAYTSVWSRDSVITSLGACLLGDEFKVPFYKSLMTLKKYQDKKGEIPNAVDMFSKRKKKVTYQTIDSSLWYIIGNYVYAKVFDKKILRKNKKSIEKALLWVKSQDSADNGLPDQLPTTDWQDAFPHKYGETLNTQALYYKCLKLMKDKESLRVKKLVNGKRKDLNFFRKDFYLPYVWKSHGEYREEGTWFDSLANMMSIIFGLAEKNKALKILRYIDKKKINRPYPMKTIYPAIKRNSKYWRDYYLDSGSIPNSYLNGGIWLYNGGFYVAALVKMKKFRKAKKELEKLAEGCLKGKLFPEWIHPKTKEAFGQYQAWNAGMYIFAYNCVKKKRVLLI